MAGAPGPKPVSMRPGHGQRQRQGRRRGLDQGLKPHDHRPRPPAFPAARLLLNLAEGATCVRETMAGQRRAANGMGLTRRCCRGWLARWVMCS